MNTLRSLSCVAAAANLLLLAPAQATFTGGGPSGRNVLNNTCNRVNAQSTIKDGSLWIDGGSNTFTNFTNGDPLQVSPAAIGGLPAIFGENLYTIQIPLNYTWDWKINITEIALNKSADPMTNNAPPVVEQAALFEGASWDPRIWLFGGNVRWDAMNFTGFVYPLVSQYSLWSYNTSDNVWNQHDISDVVPYRPTNGANAAAPNLGLGFWLNGEIDSGSSMEAQDFGSYEVVFDDGLIVINFNGEQPTANNISTGALGWPRSGGSMEYVPTWGDEGLLVIMGGGNKSHGDNSADAEGTYIPMTDLWVYDVAMANDTKNSGNGFYFQTADGDVPAAREDFCLVGVETPDKSSYTIYLYGGRDGNTVYDDVYALSLPSFTWTQLYGGKAPRFGHQCHLANNRQMITVGGSASTNLTSQCDWEVRGVAMFDLPTSGWGSLFLDDDVVGDYSLPPKVSNAIGASPSGSNPTKVTPSGGFSSDQLATLFTQKPGTSKGGLQGGAIAGIVIGIIAGLAVIVALIYFLAIRPRQKRKQAAAKAAATEEAGLARGHSDERDDSEGSGNRSDDSGLPQMSESRVEMDGRGVVMLEKDGEVLRPEMADTEVRYEMDATDAEVRAELPSGATSKFGSDVKKPLF